MQARVVQAGGEGFGRRLRRARFAVDGGRRVEPQRQRYEKENQGRAEALEPGLHSCSSALEGIRGRVQWRVRSCCTAGRLRGRAPLRRGREAALRRRDRQQS